MSAEHTGQSPCPCRGCTTAYKAGYDAGVEAVKEAAYQSAPLQVRQDEVRRLYNIGHSVGVSAAREAVAFHEPVYYGQKYGVEHGEGRMVCDYCDNLNWSTEGLDQKDDIDWPCPTVAAIDALRGE